MATDAKQFTGWMSVEDGLVNLAHVRRIALIEIEGLHLVVAYLEDGEQVTFGASDNREASEKALRYIAANVKAIYPVRQS